MHSLYGKQNLVLFVTLLLVLPLTGCRTRITTTHVTAPTLGSAITPEGIYYYLPRTKVRITATLIQEKKKPGDLVGFARYFFPGSSIITVASTKYSIDTDSISISTLGVKDTTQMYRIDPTSGSFTDTNFHFVMTDQSVPGQITASVENHALDVALTVVENTATLFAKAAAPSLMLAAKQLDRFPEDDKVGKSRLNTLLKSCPNAKDFTENEKERYASLPAKIKDLYCYLDGYYRGRVFTDGDDDYSPILEEYLRVQGVNLRTNPRGVDPANPNGPTFIEQFIVARTAYLALIKLTGKDGSFLPDSLEQVSDATLKIAIEAKQAKAKELTARFLGSTTTVLNYWSPTFEVDPANGSANLFGFSENEGLCAINLSILTTKTMSTTTCTSAVPWIAVSFDPSPSGTAAAAILDTKNSGLRYRIPSETTILLQNGTEELARRKVMVAQFGNVATLPSSTTGSKLSTDVKFDAATGALLDITVGKNSILNADLAKRVSDIASTAIDAKQKIEAQDKPASEFDQTQAARKLKQEQLKSKLLDQCLADPTTAGCSDLASTDE